ncbi:unnamed protein product [Ascophyllum nodosum]
MNTLRLAAALCMLIGDASGHWNSKINLAGGRRLKEEGSGDSINAAWQCDPPESSTQSPPVAPEDPNDYHLRGVNIGSWMVLEPWITPSMFFQFLGKDVSSAGQGKTDVGMDMYTFCQALGPKEGNAQLRRHWATWVRELDIAELATAGVNTIRLPVGDWMYQPYGPYVGCTDGALEEVDRLFELCRRYGMHVLLDIHALAGSQNGFDNSGHAMDIEWTTYSGNLVAGTATFVHWPYRSARWMGDFDRTTGTYHKKDEDAIAHTLLVIQTMVDMYANNSVVMGLQPVNEPWQFTPIEWLKDFYWDGYHIVREQAPHWLFLMHDSFNFNVDVWGDFMKNCPTIGLDTHIYQAWNPPGPEASYLASACNMKQAIQTMESAGMPVVVGEWSLATDNCAMWLNGFNDNLPGFPQVPCRFVRCPLPYMGGDQPGAPVNPNMPPLGPFGTGSSTPSYGNCPIDGYWHNEDEFMTNLAYSMLHTFDAGHGWFFWNFRTELEVRWDYIAATDKGYFPYHVDNLENNEDIIDACNKFNSHYPAKGMPPGIYAADNDVRAPMNNMMPFALGAVSCLFVVGSLITARWLRHVNQW